MMTWCVIRENKVMNLPKFCKGLNDNFRKKVMLLSVFTLDQTYNVLQDYVFFIKSQWTKHQDHPSTTFKSQFRNNISF